MANKPSHLTYKFDPSINICTIDYALRYNVYRYLNTQRDVYKLCYESSRK